MLNKNANKKGVHKGKNTGTIIVFRDACLGGKTIKKNKEAITIKSG